MDESGFAIGEKQGGLLSMPIFVNDIKQSLGVRSGSQWWSVFAPMEVSFHLSSFSKRKIFQLNGFQQTLTAIGDLIATQKDGQAISMGWTGLNNILIPKHTTKRPENILFSFVTDTIATLLETSLLIALTITFS